MKNKKYLNYKIFLLLSVVVVESTLLVFDKHIHLQDFRAELYAILFAFLEYKDRV
tara:strand:+ start:103 stop:267 length:165 start_codon:yes stop_codon:yes gene_type:complete